MPYVHMLHMCMGIMRRAKTFMLFRFGKNCAYLDRHNNLVIRQPSQRNDYCDQKSRNLVPPRHGRLEPNLAGHPSLQLSFANSAIVQAANASTTCQIICDSYYIFLFASRFFS